MDNTKQPGIKIDAILLVESTFVRAKVLPTNLENVFSFETANVLSFDGKILTTEVMATLNSEKHPIFMKAKMAGIFSQTDLVNLDLEEFAKSTAPTAIIFPYLREEISTRLIKAGIHNAIIPVVNLNGIFKNNITKKDEAKLVKPKKKA